MKALGLMEFLGYLPAVGGLDAALKAADVRLQSCRRDGGGLVSLLITGEVAAVRASLGAARVASRGTLLSASVIARPADQLAAMLVRLAFSPLGAPRPEKEETGEAAFAERSFLPAALPPALGKGPAREARHVDKEPGAMTLAELRALARELGLPMGEKKIKRANKRTLLAAMEREQER